MISLALNIVTLSFIFKFTERLLAKAIGLIVGVVLARYLAPEIFGFLAIINVFINLSITFVQSGLGVSLIQSKDVNEDSYSTVFWVSFIISVLLIVIIFFSAPYICTFYENDIILWPLRVYSISLIAGAFNSVQISLLQREMQFEKMMYANILATIVSGVIAIIAVYYNLSLWSLIIYNFSSIVLNVIFIYKFQQWYPKFIFSCDEAKRHFSFGYKLLMAALITSLYNNLNTLIIGKKFSTRDLAFYDRGHQFPEIMANTIDVSIQSVMLPVMSKQQDNITELKRLLYLTIRGSMVFTIPIMIGLFSVSDILIPLLLTDKWVNCIPLMKCFCLAYIAYPIQSSNLSLIKAMGRSDIYMKLESVRRFIMIIILIFILLLFDSVYAMAIGYVVSYWIDAIVIILATKKLISTSIMEQFKLSWRPALAGIIMGFFVGLLNNLNYSNTIILLLQICIGICIYGIVIFLLKEPGLIYVLNRLKNKV